MSSKELGIFWWIAWIVLTIGSFFISYAFWTPWIAQRVGSMDQSGAPVLWVTAVFGSWMILLIPLIIVMYYKVDKAYEDARLRRESQSRERENARDGARIIQMPGNSRLLSNDIQATLRQTPWTIPHGHLVNVTLVDGRIFENVFVKDCNQIMGIYDRAEILFDGDDVSSVQIVPQDKIPTMLEERWLRFDGVDEE